MPAEPLKIILRGGDADCAVVSLAMFTDLPYADVVRELIRHDTMGGAEGLTKHVIRRTMAGLGHPVRWTKHVDFEDAYGMLWVNYRGGHLTVLKRGQIVDTRATWCGIWDCDDYLKSTGYKVEGIFLARD